MHIRICISRKNYKPLSGKSWRTTPDGIKRLIRAERIFVLGKNPYYRQYHGDFGHRHLENSWHDTAAGFSDPKRFVVQTHEKIIQRCILMTSKPGDLVLDPTCGGGTTATVAEHWGRRWITIDSSRIAIALTRERLLTKWFPYYSLKNKEQGPSSGFNYKTLPHIELGRDIGQNHNLDPIFDKHEALLKKKLETCNKSLGQVNHELRSKLVQKLANKLQNEGINSVTNSDKRRWLLPGTTSKQIRDAFSGKGKIKSNHIDSYIKLLPPSDKFEHWHIPFDSDSDWPEELINSVGDYKETWSNKMDEVNNCIAENAEQEELVDQAEISNDIIRVSGPFTVEGVRPEELSLDENGEIFDPTPNEWDFTDVAGDYAQNASAYIDRMLQLIERDGVTFPNNEHRNFAFIEKLEDIDSALHAEAQWEDAESDEPCNVAIAFGPQHGPLTAEQVEDLIRASRRYDELVIAGFSFDGAAQAIIQESENPRLKIHMVHIRPDISPGMDGLLKDTPQSQLFTVFGQPEIEIRSAKDSHNSEIEVELLGVDIYSPLTGEISSSGVDKVAAWFLDSDYDGRCFCITQAFFPNQNAWHKIARALDSSADAEAFAAYKGAVSLPFEPGQHNRIAVKVIDPRGNEVMAIRSLQQMK